MNALAGRAAISCLNPPRPMEHWHRLRSEDGDVILAHAQARFPMLDDRQKYADYRGSSAETVA